MSAAQANHPDILADVVAYLPVGLWVARAPGGEVVYANRAFREILGMEAVSGVDIEGAPATYGIFDRQGRPYPVDRLPFSRALQTGRAVQVDDLVIHRADQRRVYLRAFATPMRAGTDGTDLVIVVFTDITAEVLAIADREKAEAHLDLALQHAPITIYALDTEGVITLARGAGIRAAGLPPDLVGRSVLELFPSDSPVTACVRRALAGETMVETLPAGEAFFDAFMTPVRNREGRITGVIGIATDVTQQRRLQAKAIQNDRVMAMGTLAASMAHEINNPLSYILGSLDEIDRTWARQDPESLRASLKAVRAGAERIRDVTRDLRSFSRPDEESVSAVELRAVVGAVLELVRKDIEARARLVLKIEDTPAVRANEARLVQVVLNLLVNAWQALEPGDPERKQIGLSTYRDGLNAVVEVWDSGPGIPVEDRDRIFEPFFTTKPVGQGTGLGLFVCRNIVSGFGGEISVRDRPGGGSVFRVILPAAVAPAGRKLTPPLGSPRFSATPARSSRRARILIVDDDEWVSRTLVKRLEHDFDARAERDGARAVALILADPGLDLVFCDLVMQGLTGMDIYARVQGSGPELLPRLVFMTGGAFTSEAADFVEQHPEAVVYKPFDIVVEARRRLATLSLRAG
jgi:two-component system, cell cycle sensor histidine kinase and response regulator CckA